MRLPPLLLCLSSLSLSLFFTLRSLPSYIRRKKDRPVGEVGESRGLILNGPGERQSLLKATARRNRRKEE